MMPTGYNAVFRIDQVQSDGVSVGSPGVSRRDIWLSQLVTLTPVSAPEAASTTYKWEFLDKPSRSSAVFLNSSNGLPQDTAKVVSFIPDVWGTYRVQLTINGGQYTERRLIAPTYSPGGELIHRGWRLPAYKESGEEANFPGHSRGYAGDMDAMLEDVCTNGFAFHTSYALVGSTATTTLTVPKVIGATLYDPSTDLPILLGAARYVRFQALLETTSTDYPAVLQLYDKTGVTGSVDVIAELSVTSTTGQVVDVDLTQVLGSVTGSGVLECWLKMGASGQEHVTCLFARLLVTNTPPAVGPQM